MTSNMKRYLVFAGYEYYPAGGWSDFFDSFETWSDAEDAATSEGSRLGKETNGGWAQVVDTQGERWQQFNFGSRGRRLA